METRINRILDETRRIPKALGRRGWTALAILAAPLIYMAATIQLAPAQTVVAPAPPAPPQPPAPVTITQAPALPVAAPVPPPAPALGQSQGNVDQAILDVDRELAELEQIMKVRQARLQAIQLAQSQAQFAQAPAPPPPPPSPGPTTEIPLHVDVTSIRLTTISTPLDPTQRYDVIIVVETETGQRVQEVRSQAEYRREFETQMPLKAGKYVLKILVRNRKDGKMGTQQSHFEVE